MTFNPAPLVALGQLIESHGVVNVGIKGDSNHVNKGVSYHLGADQLTEEAYSRVQARDVAGLSDAASAIDIGFGKNLAGLQLMSKWLVAECRRLAPDTHDIREVIYSADGLKVSRWESLDNKIHTGKGQGDNSHLKHTHVSFYRDSEARDKLALFRRFFEEGDVRITLVKGEDWTPTKNVNTGLSNGVLRAVPDRGAPVVKTVPLGTMIRSIAEVRGFADSNWRLTKFEGLTLFMLRSDFTPRVQNGDAAIDQGLTNYIAAAGT